MTDHQLRADYRKNSSPQLRGSIQPLLFFRVEPVGDLLGDQEGVAAGAVVDDETNLDLVLYAFVHDFLRVLDPFRIQHPREHFLKKGRTLAQDSE